MVGLLDKLGNVLGEAPDKISLSQVAYVLSVLQIIPKFYLISKIFLYRYKLFYHFSFIFKNYILILIDLLGLGLFYPCMEILEDNV